VLNSVVVVVEVCLDVATAVFVDLLVVQEVDTD
jgi:hypothetical protein